MAVEAEQSRVAASRVGRMGDAWQTTSSWWDWVGPGRRAARPHENTRLRSHDRLCSVEIGLVNQKVHCPWGLGQHESKVALSALGSHGCGCFWEAGQSVSATATAVSSEASCENRRSARPQQYNFIQSACWYAQVILPFAMCTSKRCRFRQSRHKWYFIPVIHI